MTELEKLDGYSFWNPNPKKLVLRDMLKMYHGEHEKVYIWDRANTKKSDWLSIELIKNDPTILDREVFCFKPGNQADVIIYID